LPLLISVNIYNNSPTKWYAMKHVVTTDTIDPPTQNEVTHLRVYGTIFTH